MPEASAVRVELLSFVLSVDGVVPVSWAMAIEAVSKHVLIAAASAVTDFMCDLLEVIPGSRRVRHERL
jgi:hypothetical protein